MVNESKPSMVTLYYIDEHATAVNALVAEQFQTTFDNSTELTKLKGECPDFSNLIKYHKDQTVPEDQKYTML